MMNGDLPPIDTAAEWRAEQRRQDPGPDPSSAAGTATGPGEPEYGSSALAPSPDEGEHMMVDVPGAPDALVDAELWSNAAAAYVEVERERSALRARLAKAEPLLRQAAADLRAWCETTWATGDTPEILKRIDAFLAGSATPPEAPQRTALERLAAADMQEAKVWPNDRDGGWTASARIGELRYKQRQGPTPDAALLALADAVAPTEADRP